MLETSIAITELSAALSKAQGEMGSAKKGTDNTFYKSKYADLAEVIKAIKEPSQIVTGKLVSNIK